MNFLFFNSKTMRLETLPYMFVARHVDGREMKVYTKEEDIEQVVKRYLENGFTISSTGPIELTPSQEQRFNEVKSFVEEHPRPKYLGNFDVLEHFIFTGYLDTKSELGDLREVANRHMQDATYYYSNLLHEKMTLIRDQLKYRPVIYKGLAIKLDQEAINNIYFLYSGLTVSGLRENTTQFKLLDKTFTQFSAEDITEVYKLTYRRVQDIFKMEELATRWLEELTLNQIVNFVQDEGMLYDEMNKMLEQVKG